ncbi:MAG TPA: S8 family peptidase [Symbiobacteriaceae bacterium]|nr:S8 family peptidase [Symbiobacteriaceae bacterium]
MDFALNRRRIIALLLILLSVLVPLVVPPVPVHADAGEGPLHSYLARLAAEDPEQVVEVIVAKRRGAKEDEIIRASGGKRLKSWGFIKAMRMRVPAKALSALARHPGVAYVAPDSPLRANLDQNATAAHFQAGLDIQEFWNSHLGSGVGVAVIDSGVAAHPDLQNHTVNIVLPSVGDSQDAYGHGTHVAGIIAGNNPDGLHVGMAPQATIYNLRVTDDQGNTTESKVIDALEWVYNNRAQFNIRVVNLSLQSTIPASYMSSPLDGAVERLWAVGIVVVVSAGNLGEEPNATTYPPANDPFVITVGAINDQNSKETADDSLISWSAAGTTQDGFAKPEVLAPGYRILSTLAPGSDLGAQYPHLVDGQYIRLSGTSMAAPVVSGAAAVLLHRHPSLSPDQVKHLFMQHNRGVLAVPTMSAIFTVVTNPAAVPAANQGLTPSLFADPGSGSASSQVYYDNVYYDNVYYLNIQPDHLGD